MSRNAHISLQNAHITSVNFPTHTGLPVFSGATASFRKLENRRKLMDAARRLFAHNGYDQIRIQHIAREAGVGYGTFYLNFDNKLDCFFACLNAAFVEMHKLSRRGLSLSMPFGDKLSAFANTAFAYSLARPGVLKAILSEAHALSPQRSFVPPRIAREMGVHLECCKRRNEIDGDFDIELLAYLILGAIRQGDVLLNRNPELRSLIVGNIRDFITRGAEPCSQGFNFEVFTDTQVRAVPEIVTFSTEDTGNNEIRGRILASARKLFAQHGYDAVTCKEIMECADVSVGAFYTYFKDKLDCFIVFTSEASEELRQLGQRYTSSATTFPETIFRLVSATFDYSTANPGVYRALIMDMSLLSNNEQVVPHKILSCVERVDNWKSKGLVDVRFDSRFLANLMAGIIQEADHFISRNPKRRTEIIKLIASFVIRAISPR